MAAEETSEVTKGVQEASPPGSTDTPAQCRFCLEEGAEEDFITPCRCEGTGRYVHESCLRRWQTEASTYERAAICQVCRAEFSFRPDKLKWKSGRRNINMSRAGAMPLFDVVRTNPRYDMGAISRFSRSTQAQLSTVLVPGCIVVQTPQRAQIEARRQNPDASHGMASMAAFFEAVIASRGAHWHQGIYLLAARWVGLGSDGSDALVGVNLGGAPCDFRDVPDVRELEMQLPGRPIKGFVGGPVRPDRLLALVPFEGDINNATVPQPRLVHLVPGSDEAQSPGEPRGALFGEASDVAQALAAMRSLAPLGAQVFQGHAVWSSRQLLSEVARGSWGLTRACCADLALVSAADSPQSRWASLWSDRNVVPRDLQVSDRGSGTPTSQREADSTQASSSSGCIGSGCIIC